MKKQLNLLLSAVLLLLAACTAESVEPAAESGPVSSPSVPALNTVPAAEEEETAVPVPDTPSPPVPPDEEAELPEEGATGTISGPVPAGEIDLSQVTSQAPGGGEPQEAPRPGVQDPQAEIAHIVSQDLAQRLALDISEVKTKSVEDKEWPDSSLGCSVPGMAYLTVITPGYEIVLEAGGELFTYHADWDRNYLLCGEDGRPAAP